MIKRKIRQNTRLDILFENIKRKPIQKKQKKRVNKIYKKKYSN